MAVHLFPTTDKLFEELQFCIKMFGKFLLRPILVVCCPKFCQSEKTRKW